MLRVSITRTLSAISTMSQKGINAVQAAPVSTEIVMAASAAAVTMLPVGWVLTNYYVAKPNQYVVGTGPFIKDMKVVKKALGLPFQKLQMVDVNPTTYTFRLHNMSKGKVEFELPVVMTIGPVLPDDDASSFETYCRLLQDMSAEDIEDTVKGIIEGETRGLTASLTVEEMFNGKEAFREHVIDKLAPDLAELGLRIYNANIQEMKDYDDNNKYFEYRKQRAIEMANNEARSDVAAAQRQGDIAVAENQRETRIAVADYERQATELEYAAREAVLQAEAKVAIQEAETMKARQMSKLKAEQDVALMKEQTQREIEEKHFEQEIQAQKAKVVAIALAEAEATERRADATLYAALKEAEATYKLLEAKAEGVDRLVKSCGSEDLAKFYIGTDAQLWQKMAEESAKAVHDMKPEVTVWNTGSDGNANGMLPLVNMVQGVTPMLKEVGKQFFPKDKSNNTNKTNN